MNFWKHCAPRPDIDWKRVTAFHMDEYVGLDAAAPRLRQLFARPRVRPFALWPSMLSERATRPTLRPNGSRYAGLLAQAPIDIVFMGIGENGHIAFNDPPVAEFDDPAAVKVVALDEVCRNQQVHDGCFADIGQVPTHALTLTVPTLAGAKHHLCIVPAPTKAKAVRDTLEGPVSTACPASILRTCPGAVLYLERESAQLLTEV